MANITTGEVDVVSILYRIIHSVILIAVMVTGLFGNTLIFTAYCLSRKLQTKTNIFVINLAAADILTCVSFPAPLLTRILDVDVNTTPSLKALCAVHSWAVTIFLGASFMTLAFIAVNRYFLITKRQETYTRLYQKKFIFIFLSVSWLYPMLSLIPQLNSGFRNVGLDEKTRVCKLGTDHRTRSFLYDMFLVISTMLVITTIVYSYAGIYLFLRRHNKKMQKRMFPKPGLR